jgi:hypothetical protein
MPLTLELVPYTVQLARELHDLGSFRDVAFEHDTTTQRMIAVMNDPSWFFQVAKDDDGIVCGAMCGCVDTFFFSRQLVANEHALYVREGTKGRTRIAAQLVRNFIKWALDDKHATHVQTGDVAAINSLAVAQFYKHLGFQQWGVIYKYSRPGSVV